MIKVLRRKTKDFRDFDLREWPLIDLEHFGRKTTKDDWKEEKYYFETKENNKVIGTLSMDIQTGVCYIHTLLVAKDHRGKGLGKKLMQEAERISKKHGAHKIWLETGKDWEAVKFYKSLGYKITGELPRHHFKHDALILTKLL